MNTQELHKLLIALYTEQDELKRKEFQRSLSFQETLFDRWQRAKILGFAEESSVYNSALIFGDVSVGKSTWVGPNTLLDGSGGEINIGAFCSISAGVHIYTHDSVEWAITGGKKKFRYGGVNISERCYIGSQAIINRGVTLGKCCVVGANSFVNASFDENSILAGSPAKKIGEVKIIHGEVKFHYFKD